MPKRITEEEKYRMRELRSEGMTYDAIAVIVGYSSISVACACDPARKARAKEYQQSLEYKARKSVYCQTQEYKDHRKILRQTPEQKAKRKVYSQTQKVKDYESSAKIQEYRKNYRKLETTKIRTKAYRQTPKRKAAEKKYSKTIGCRLRNNLRSRLYKAVNRNQKTGSAVSDLGCTINELKARFESMFKPGMTWDNWSEDGWHIDHIKPLASFDLTDRDQFLEACHYTNLQPLWAKDNLSKGSKILPAS